jgi:hypothetical protein
VSPSKPVAGPPREAVLHYGTPDFEVVEPGEFVRCAVTGKPISLHLLTYWSVPLQEAYVSAELMTRRWVETNPRST